MDFKKKSIVRIIKDGSYHEQKYKVGELWYCYDINNLHAFCSREIGDNTGRMLFNKDEAVLLKAGDLIKALGREPFMITETAIKAIEEGASYLGGYRIGNLTYIEDPAKQELKMFPMEGSCKSLDIRLLKYLADRPGTEPKPDVAKKDAIAVAWNHRYHWYIRMSSSKDEYELSQLEKFLPVKKDSVPEVDTTRLMSDKDLMLAEAKRRYPVGTKFYPAHLDSTDYKCIVYADESEPFIIQDSEPHPNIIAFKVTNRNGHDMYPVVYYRGKWAEVISHTTNVGGNKVTTKPNPAFDKMDSSMKKEMFSPPPVHIPYDDSDSIVHDTKAEFNPSHHVNGLPLLIRKEKIKTLDIKANDVDAVQTKLVKKQIKHLF